MMKVALVLLVAAVPVFALAQQKDQAPEIAVEKWTGKTILLIGAHADDDALSHGTLAMLQAHDNQVHIVTLTTGNVGTQDPSLSRTQLAQIRRREELAALSVLGIPGERYINLGYDDGLLEFEDRKAVVENLVRQIRAIRPDVLLAFDPGRRYQRWHKSDHRAAAYLAADAARAAMWRLLFEGQILQDGLKEYTIPEYLLYDSAREDENTWVDISAFVDKKVNAGAKYMSQYGPGWKNYKPEPSEADITEMKEYVRSHQIRMKDGKPVEGFRYYRGLPDSLGK